MSSTGKPLDEATWQDVLRVQDALAKLYNKFCEADPSIRLNWFVIPAIGSLVVTFYALDGRTKIKIDDKVSWDYGTERKDETFDELCKKITKWKERYGLLDAEH